MAKMLLSGLMISSLVAASVIVHAQSDHTAVVNFRSNKITVYMDSNGKKKHIKHPIIREAEVVLPIPILDGPSKKGFFRLRIEFLGGESTKFDGWVRKRVVKTDKVLNVDSRCAKFETQTPNPNKVRTSGIRGLGGGC